ncbi:DUF6443 domain-containing protein, partial [Sphingobacterium sp.]|uniref:DUF6443 domain-containing protein n=1 Tax=Sphingobacterium sp. TaxID=341027 RepID=UPI00289EF3AC
MKKTLYILVLLLAFIVGKLYAQHTTLMLRHNQSDYIGTFPADFSLTVNYEANDVGWTSGLQFVLTQPTNLILYIPDAYQREVMIQANDDVVTTEPFYPSTYNMPQYTQGGPVTIQGINLQPGSYDMLVRPNGRGTIYITGMAVARPNGDPEVAPLAEPAALMDPSAIKLASTLNYTAVIRPRAEVGSLEMSGGVLGNYAAANASVSVQYYDGFSRPVQQVDYRASPGGKDLVRVLEYTALDRAGRQWLPAAFRTNGAYFQPSAIKARSRLSNGDQAPFSFSTYENSELDRITAQTGAGNAWHAAGRSDRTDYLTNGAVSALSCRKYTSGSNGPLFAGLYGDSLLNVVRTTDENGQQSLVFTDISGQQVLHRKILDGVNLDTYYIYDDLGNLSYVLPPGSGADVSLPSQTLLDSYCYQYRYDGRNRPIAKKLPGRGWEFFVYNRQGQVVAEQDALQRAASPQRWTFTRYDNIGRVIATGLYQQNGSTGDSAAVPSTSSRDQLQASVNGLPQWDVRDTGNIGTGYGNTSFPAADAGVLHYLSISWYDDYTFPGAALVSSQGLVSGNTAGLQTGARLYQTDGTSPYLKATYYDRRGRVSEEVSQNHVNVSDRVRNR